MNEEVARVFDAWAGDGRDAGLESGHADVVQQVVAELNIRPGAMILDLGCGNGWATRLLAKQAPGAQAIGIDCSTGMIARADELHSFTIRARYERGDIEALEYAEGHFDHVFSMEALYYANDPDKVLSEVARVLKPGGRADLVLDYYSERPGQGGWAAGVGLQLHRLSEAEWISSLERAGLGNGQARRVIDGRGPGEEGSFEPDQWRPDWEAHLAAHEAGSLWLSASLSA